MEKRNLVGCEGEHGDQEAAFELCEACEVELFEPGVYFHEVDLVAACAQELSELQDATQGDAPFQDVVHVLHDDVEQFYRDEGGVDGVPLVLLNLAQPAFEKEVGELGYAVACHACIMLLPVGCDVFDRLDYPGWQGCVVVELMVFHSAQHNGGNVLNLRDEQESVPFEERHRFKGVELVEGPRLQEVEEVSLYNVHAVVCLVSNWTKVSHLLLSRIREFKNFPSCYK